LAFKVEAEIKTFSLTFDCIECNSEKYVVHKIYEDHSINKVNFSVCELIIQTEA